LSAFLCIDILPATHETRRLSRARAVSSPNLFGRASSRVASPTPTTAAMLNPSTAGTSIPREETREIGSRAITTTSRHRFNRRRIRAAKTAGHVISRHR
jgi:hypothetical protein